MATNGFESPAIEANVAADLWLAIVFGLAAEMIVGAIMAGVVFTILAWLA